MDVQLKQFELTTKEWYDGMPIVQCCAEVALFLEDGQQIAAVNQAALKQAIAQVVKQVVLVKPVSANKTDSIKTKEE